MSQSRIRLTKHRVNALAEVVVQADASGALLLLLDEQAGQLFAIPSYGTGCFSKFIATLENKAIRFNDLGRSPNELRSIQNELVSFAQRHGWRSQASSHLKALPVVAPDSELEPVHPSGNLLGFVILEFTDATAAKNFADTKVSTQNLSIAIQSTRDRRFREAILHLHGELANRSAELDYDERHFFDLIKSEISAGHYEIHECDPYCQPDEDRLTGVRSANGNSRRDIDYKNNDIEICNLDQQSLEVPLTELSYQLEPTKFTSHFLADQKFKRMRCVSKYVSFTLKSVKDYHQPFFSTEDRQIAATMFDLAQGILDLEKIDASRSALLKSHKFNVTFEDDYSIAPPKIKPDVQTIAFFRVRIDIFGNPLTLRPEPIFGKAKLSDKYCSRLREFAVSFYSGNESRDEMQTGIDIQGKYAIHEFHMPSDEGVGAIYLIFYKSKYISRATYLEHHRIMENYFVDLKRNELQQSRSTILSQTRHAVIHYFTLARDSLRLIKNEWSDGRKDEDFWMSLLGDVDFQNMIDNATWSINHANQILENGRFLVRDIDPQSIVKHTFDLEKIIEDCLRVLSYQRTKNSLVLFHKISGKKDGRLTGDVLLMRIAILNLFDNAIKYAPHRSQVRWSIDYRKDSYRFAISNIGDHIDPKQLAMLLRVGFRARQKDQRNRRPGTGIGLAVTQRILFAHHPNAELKLTSEDAKGFPDKSLNTFYFEMPYLTGVEHW